MGAFDSICVWDQVNCTACLCKVSKVYLVWTFEWKIIYKMKWYANIRDMLSEQCRCDAKNAFHLHWSQFESNPWSLNRATRNRNFFLRMLGMHCVCNSYVVWYACVRFNQGWHYGDIIVSTSHSINVILHSFNSLAHTDTKFDPINAQCTLIAHITYMCILPIKFYTLYAICILIYTFFIIYLIINNNNNICVTK